MQVNNVSNINFKGFNCIAAGRVLNDKGKCLVLSVRLNNDGVKDFDRFAKILDDTDAGDILTINMDHATVDIEAMALAVNSIPLISDLRTDKINQLTLHLHEKDVFPIVRNVMDLLKRVSTSPKNIKPYTDDVGLEKTLNATVDTMAGEYMVFDKLVKGLKTSVLQDYLLNGADNVNKSVADGLYQAFNKKMCKYFE